MLQNIDNILQSYAGTFGVTWNYIAKKLRFCSCAMVIKPSKSIYKDLMNKKSSLYSYDSGDQGLFITYFSEYLLTSGYEQLPLRVAMDKFNVLGQFFARQIDVWLIL